MSETDQSFLPQIVGVFYATFDPKLGPTVIHQVPEDLITSSTDEADPSPSRSVSRSRSPSRVRSTSRSSSPSVSGRGSSSSAVLGGSGTYGNASINGNANGNGNNSNVRGSSIALLDFTPISDYVIPKKALMGKLVSFITTGRDERRREYRVMGYPCVLSGEGGKYVRNEYMWNLCFVFEASSSLEAFEPVVRKSARILRSAEIDSAYLSRPSTEHTSLTAVLEQLFEDLNSYSETSIPLDGFNSLELKLFPFYPNPPECQDWHVPIALVDFAALQDDNWDITAARVSKYIDGVNHVGRIAQLADAEPEWVKETLRHMLFYQVIMVVDIFQYSNMYTIKPSVAHLVSDESIIAECAAYVIRRNVPKQTKPSWPELLRLYAKLQPGITVHQWIEENGVLALGIDPRRFVSFGIIKGFLRRVHRWPIMLERKAPLFAYTAHSGRRRVEFKTQFGSATTLSVSTRPGDSALLTRSGPGDSTFTLRSMDSHASASHASHTSLGVSPSSIPNRTPPSVTRSPSRRPVPLTSTHTDPNMHQHHQYHPQQQHQHQHQQAAHDRHHPGGSNLYLKDSYTRSMISAGGETQPSQGSRRGHVLRGTALRAKEAEERRFEEDLIGYLDGRHHTDEIQVRFGLSWGQLERLLGVGEIRDGVGRKGVTLVYR